MIGEASSRRPVHRRGPIRPIRRHSSEHDRYLRLFITNAGGT